MHFSVPFYSKKNTNETKTNQKLCLLKLLSYSLFKPRIKLPATSKLLFQSHQLLNLRVNSHCSSYLIFQPHLHSWSLLPWFIILPCLPAYHATLVSSFHSGYPSVSCADSQFSGFGSLSSVSSLLLLISFIMYLQQWLPKVNLMLSSLPWTPFS